MAQSAIRRLPNPPASPHRRAPLRGRSLGLKVSNSADLIQQVERGFSFKALQTFGERSGISVSQIAVLLGIPERTLARRKSSGRLNWEESERLLRLSAVYEDALQLFEGDSVSSMAWLTSSQKALGSQTPLVHARTEIGAREVEDLVGRLEHGVFS
jgi:putative toxin-antitoxin system antitoxin component (TIGR02293 family)